MVMKTSGKLQNCTQIELPTGKWKLLHFEAKLYQVINMVNNYKGSNNKYQLSFHSLKNYETGVYH